MEVQRALEEGRAEAQRTAFLGATGLTKFDAFRSE